MEQPAQSLPIRSSFFRDVTTFSKAASLILFILIPMATLYAGYRVGVWGNTTEVRLVEATTDSSREPATSTIESISAQTPLAMVSKSARASTYKTATSTILFIHDAESRFCGDRPHYPCKGDLYMITERGYIMLLGSDVLGMEVIYQTKTGDILFREQAGDGSCRYVKYYTYNDKAASSTLDFSLDTCDGTDAGGAAFDQEIREYLARYGL